MIDALALPVPFVLLAGAVLVVATPRRFAPLAAGAAFLVVLGWFLAVPTGVGPTRQFAGFPVQLVAIDRTIRAAGIVIIAIGLLGTCLAAVEKDDPLVFAGGTATTGAALALVLAGDWLTIAAAWGTFVAVGTGLLAVRAAAPLEAPARFGLVHAVSAGLVMGGAALAVGAGTTPGDTVVPRVGRIALGVAAAFGVGVVGLDGWLRGGIIDASPSVRMFLFPGTVGAGLIVGMVAFPGGSVALASIGAAAALVAAAITITAEDTRLVVAAQVQVHGAIGLVGVAAGAPLAGFGHVLALVIALGLILVTITKPVAVSVLSPRLAGGLVLLGAVTAVGLPGFPAFVSVGIILSALDTGPTTALVWVVLIALVGSMGGFARLAVRRARSADRSGTKQPGRLVLVVTLVTATVVIGTAGFVVIGTLLLTTAELALQAGLAVLVVVLGTSLGRAVERSDPRADIHLDSDWLVKAVVVTPVRHGADRLLALVRWADVVGTSFARGAVYAARRPNEALDSALPPAASRWYDERRLRTPGPTGIKIGLEESVYVLVLLLTAAIMLGWRG